jgi:hypothetical protein
MKKYNVSLFIIILVAILLIPFELLAQTDTLKGINYIITKDIKPFGIIKDITPAEKTYGGIIKGKITDEKTKEILPFASIMIEKDFKPITGTSTDFEGNFTINPVPPGIYNLKVMYIGYFTTNINNIEIKLDSINYQNIGLLVNPDYNYPKYIETSLLDKDPKPFGQRYFSEEINKMAW